MATRAQIIFTDKHVNDVNLFLDSPEAVENPIIYKHYDGYPEEVLEKLKVFCQAFDKNRGLSDVPYAIARCLFFFMSCDFERVNPSETFNLNKKERKAGNLNTWERHDYTSYGLDNNLHGDLSFIYIVDVKERKIHCVNMEEEEVLQDTINL